MHKWRSASSWAGLEVWVLLECILEVSLLPWIETATMCHDVQFGTDTPKWSVEFTTTRNNLDGPEIPNFPDWEGGRGGVGCSMQRQYAYTFLISVSQPWTCKGLTVDTRRPWFEFHLLKSRAGEARVHIKLLSLYSLLLSNWSQVWASHHYNSLPFKPTTFWILQFFLASMQQVCSVGSRTVHKAVSVPDPTSGVRVWYWDCCNSEYKKIMEHTGGRIIMGFEPNTWVLVYSFIVVS